MLLGQLDGLDDLYSIPGHSIVTSHLIVHLIESRLNRLSSVLLEHILIPDIGVILEIDAEVLGLDLLLSIDLLDLEDLSMGLFDLVLSSHYLPEFRLGEGCVLGDDLNDGDGWLLLTLGWLDSSIDQELLSSSTDAVV